MNQFADQRIVIAMNAGDGTFAAPTARQVPTCSRMQTLADVDADGDLDQLIGNERDCTPSDPTDGYDVSISYNNGDGTFAAPTIIKMAYRTGPIAVFDVDGDSDVDLVDGGFENMVGGQETGDVAVSLGDGSGTYTDGSLITTGQVAQVAFAPVDFEGDGDLDIASNSAQFGTTLLHNQGDGSFNPAVLPGQYVQGYTTAIGIAAGDVTGDTIPDVVVEHVTGSDVAVHAGFGDGEFQLEQVRCGLRPQVNDVELADLDGDGPLDIISPATVGDGAAAGAGTEGADVSGGPPARRRRPRRPAARLQRARRPARWRRGGRPRRARRHRGERQRQRRPGQQPLPGRRRRRVDEVRVTGGRAVPPLGGLPDHTGAVRVQSAACCG